MPFTRKHSLVLATILFHSLMLAIILITHPLHPSVFLPFPCPHLPSPCCFPELTFCSSPRHRILSVLSDAADHFQNMFCSCITASSFLGFLMGSFLLLALHAHHGFNGQLVYTWFPNEHLAPTAGTLHLLPVSPTWYKIFDFPEAPASQHFQKTGNVHSGSVPSSEVPPSEFSNSLYTLW